MNGEIVAYGTAVVFILYIFYMIFMAQLYRHNHKVLSKKKNVWYMDIRPIYHNHIINTTTEGIFRNNMLAYLFQDSGAMVYYLDKPEKFNQHFCDYADFTATRLIQETNDQIEELTSKIYEQHKSQDSRDIS